MAIGLRVADGEMRKENLKMSKGANHEVVFRFSEDELRTGCKRGWRDEWRFPCGPCDGSGGSRSNICGACSGSGFVLRVRRGPGEITIPAGSKPGTKLRLRGLGYEGNPDVPENRGDLIIVLRTYGDGREVDELPSSRTASRPEAVMQTLPPARVLRAQLGS